ncbi:uncharacterized protein sS8_5069 [Methylocaldum marinum]|uniref:Uncharacterized protein n=1 Tax=Methylocaldum marinum TaxID=1432792 RepID=A0A250KZG9_9GAMM|nr:hypothetical protein [Methylocaldum marinum]BBA36992.1 uncharacterized protein sS8_5069 [Methylocaldum marinum]
MSFTIQKDNVVPYGPEELRSFRVYGFEWIDNLHFLVDPKEFLGSRTEAYEEVAKERFLEAGWAGDGKIQLLWLPPFVFPLSLGVASEGVILWHVKQKDDGVSFLLAPVALPFEEFQQ